MKVQEVINNRIRPISSSAMLREAAERMRGLGADVLAVVENHRIVGVIAKQDLAPGALPGDVDPQTTPVKSVMTPGAVCCRQDDDVEKAIETMETANTHWSIVLDSQGETVGILSLDELTAKVGEPSTPRAPMEGENHESTCH